MIIEPHGLMIHVPRTAGTSLGAAFGINTRVNRPEALGPGVGPHRYDDHATVRAWRRHLGDAEFESRFKFGFVRNPWARLVSSHRIQEQLREPGTPMTSFATRLRTIASAAENSFWGVWLTDLPQCWFICDAGHLQLNYVGYFEQLQHDLAEIGRRLGRAIDMPHLNSSGAVDYRTYYTDETAALVAEIYADDIAMFGYTFDASHPTRRVQ